MIDSHGRNIDYLRVSLTDRCNLRCIYCMPEEGIDKKSHDDILRFEEILKIVKVYAGLGIKKVRYTGGEPLILKNIEYLICQTSKIKGIDDISITTNGMLLYDMAESLKKAGLKRVNISLDTLDREKFKYITRGGDLDRVLKSIEKSIQIGLNPVKINVVLMRGINDGEILDFVSLTKKYPVHVRFIELMPIGEGKNMYKNNFISCEEVIKNIPNLISLETVKGSTAKLYRLEDSMGTIGFITPMTCKFCSDCNRIRLTSCGTIKPCLHSESETNVKRYMDNEDELFRVLKETILNKPLEHHIEIDGESRSRKSMFQIGG